jgi:hypothetical protein
MSGPDPRPVHPAQRGAVHRGAGGGDPPREEPPRPFSTRLRTRKRLSSIVRGAESRSRPVPAVRDRLYRLPCPAGGAPTRCGGRHRHAQAGRGRRRGGGGALAPCPGTARRRGIRRRWRAPRRASCRTCLRHPLGRGAATDAGGARPRPADGAERPAPRPRGLAKAGAAVLVVLHDPNEAAFVADRVAVLAGGRLAALGTPAQALGPRAARGDPRPALPARAGRAAARPRQRLRVTAEADHASAPHRVADPPLRWSRLRGSGTRACSVRPGARPMLRLTERASLFTRSGGTA